MTFSKDFVWGAASASYQIEGAAYEDGKGRSVWDMFCERPGAIANNQSGLVSCDHYHRYREDVALMREIGLQGYRFSISWPRVLPEGTGKINQAGLDFYDQLVDELLAANIQPWVTLFHWDYPYSLFCRGGWLNPDSPKWFAEYAQLVVERLSDRVQNWMTQNEPQCFIGLGHFDVYHAPGLKFNFREVLLAAHHSLVAHGLGVQAIRAYAKTTPFVGFAPVGVVSVPANNEAASIEAARAEMFAIKAKNVWNNTWWADPVVLGQYPEDGLKLFGADVPKYTPQDMETIKQPLDFYGVNIYSGGLVQAGANGQGEAVTLTDGYPITNVAWGIIPQSLYWGPKFLQERYGLPIVVTENGMAGLDWVARDGAVHDPQRIDFLHQYLSEYHRAVQDGLDARGYFQWSLTDNFEWAEGFKVRFGLAHVDYTTQKRTLKESAYWYRDVIAGRVNFIN